MQKIKRLNEHRVPIRIRRKRQADMIGIVLITISVMGLFVYIGAGIYHDFYLSDWHHFVKG